MKIFTLSLVLLSSAFAFGQPFLGMGGTNRGANFRAGVLTEIVELTMAYSVPLRRVDVPTILSLSVGKQIFLSSKAQDAYSFTAAIGGAFHTVKNLKAYNEDPTGATGITKLNTARVSYRLELGKDSYLGRFYAAANYCHGFYYGIGLRFFAFRYQ